MNWYGRIGGENASEAEKHNIRLCQRRCMASPTLCFVCVQNAGRSQMAAAFARRECERRGVEATVLTGGTDPAAAVHEEVLETMQAVDIDLSGREPREISTDELGSCDVVATMGCSTLSLADVETRDWALPDPEGKPPDRVREIRDRVRDRVTALFDELERTDAFDAGREHEAR